MKYAWLIIPSLAAALAVSAISVFLDLGSTVSYGLIVSVGLLIVGLGILGDLGIFNRQGKRSEVVKVHEAAIRTEKADGSITPIRDFVPGFVQPWNKDREGRLPPVTISASRTRTYSLVLQQRQKRVRAAIRPGHYLDPMPKQHA